MQVHSPRTSDRLSGSIDNGSGVRLHSKKVAMGWDQRSGVAEVLTERAHLLKVGLNGGGRQLWSERVILLSCGDMLASTPFGDAFLTPHHGRPI